MLHTSLTHVTIFKLCQAFGYAPGVPSKTVFPGPGRILFLGTLFDNQIQALPLPPPSCFEALSPEIRNCEVILPNSVKATLFPEAQTGNTRVNSIARSCGTIKGI